MHPPTSRPQRTRVVTVRLTAEEFKRLERGAREGGKTISEWVRARAVPKTPAAK